MNKQKISATLAALALMAGAMVGVAGPAMATQPENPGNQPDNSTCLDLTAGLGYEAKVDTAGDPATVPYTAPSGYLVDAYCVKAGSVNSGGGPLIVTLATPSASITIDHPNVGSVSHYQVHLIPVPVLPGPSGSVVFTDGSCVADVVTGNSATLTLGDGSTALYYINDVLQGAVTAGTYNDLAAGSYKVEIVGQNGQVITQTHVFAAVPTSCPPPPTPTEKVDVKEEIVCPTDEAEGIVNITTTTTTYQGTTVVDVKVVNTTRALTAQELKKCEDDNKKVWVCKFVASENAPHGYVLKDGKNPIHVSVNALGDDVNNTGTFNDAQPSFVVDSENAKCADTKSEVKEEIVCPVDGKGGIVNITTTTTTYYGTTVVDVKVVKTTRALTAQELANCDLPTFDLVMPKVSSVQPTCTADGSFTLGVEAGYNPAYVKWIVDGVANVASGTYPVTTSRTVTIVAVPVAPHGFEFGWNQPAPIKFTVPNKAVCGDLPTFDLPTLAYTGSGTDGGAGLLFAGGLLVLGAAGVYSRRRWAARS
jgi:hypothetical protein